MATSISPSEGTVPTSTGVLFVAKAPMHVTYMNFYNTNVAPQVIVLYISPRGGGNATEIRRMALNRFEHYVVRERIPLAADDEIQADTNTASAVKYIVGGETNA